MTFDPTSVEVTGVTLPKDHCVQVPWEYINVCGYSDEFCKLPHTYIHILRTYYVHTTYYILHTTYRISDHIVSLRRDKKKKKKKTLKILKPIAQSYAANPISHKYTCGFLRQNLFIGLNGLLLNHTLKRLINHLIFFVCICKNCH